MGLFGTGAVCGSDRASCFVFCDDKGGGPPPKQTQAAEAANTAAEAAGSPRPSLTPMRDANQPCLPGGHPAPVQIGMGVEPMTPTTCTTAFTVCKRD